MDHLISPPNRTYLGNLLLKLQPNTQPLWGKMKPQQMVEHLVENVEYTNGKKICGLGVSPEAAERGKHTGVYTDSQIPKNLILEELPENFRYPNLNIAIGQLVEELNDFDKYFETPNATSMHFSFGPMDHEEWLIWHSKHFTHHLKQFGLM